MERYIYISFFYMKWLQGRENWRTFTINICFQNRWGASDVEGNTAMQLELDMFIFLQKVFFLKYLLCFIHLRTIINCFLILQALNIAESRIIWVLLNKLNRFIISVIIRCFFLVTIPFSLYKNKCLSNESTVLAN